MGICLTNERSNESQTPKKASYSFHLFFFSKERFSLYIEMKPNFSDTKKRCGLVQFNSSKMSKIEESSRYNSTP